MSTRYDPARSTSFKAIVIGRLSNRCVDWMRQHRGRTRWQFAGHTYERELPRPVSLDAADERDPMAVAVRTDRALDAIAAVRSTRSFATATPTLSSTSHSSGPSRGG